MKKSFGCIYFLFYILSLVVLEVFLDTTTFFNYAIFMGFAIFLEIVSVFVFYVVYKVSNYYNLQGDQFNSNQSVFFIFKKVLGLSVISSFLVFLLSQFLSSLIIGNNSLDFTIKLSSVLFLILPSVGLFRGFLYTLDYKNIVLSSYLECSFLQFILLIVVSLICYFFKFDSSHILILGIIFSYLVIFLHLFICFKRQLKYVNKKRRLSFFKEDSDSLINRVNTYSFIFIFILLFLFMLFDVFYGRILLDTGVPLKDVETFDIITIFIGPFFNIIFIFSFICVYGRIVVSKDNLLSTIIGLLKISLPVTVFISMVYNYYPIYKYFIYLVPLQLGCLIVLIFLYNQNKRKIIFNSICLMFLTKHFLNIVLLNSFKYTGILNYNSLITSSILAYLFLFVVLIVYSVAQFKLAGEVFIKSLFDMIINLVFSVSILLIIKQFFYYDNVFFAMLYVIFGMLLYMFIPKIIKRL